MKIAVIGVNALVLLTCVAANGATPRSAAIETSPAADTAVSTAATAEVIAAAAAIVAAFARHDPGAYFALFAPEATFVFHTTPRRLESRAEYEAEWAKWEKEDGFRVRSCRSTDQRVQVLGDVAIFTHSVRTELSTTRGTSIVHERETIVFQRRGGRWIAVHEHLSPHAEQDAPA